MTDRSHYRIILRRSGIPWHDVDAMARLLFEELPRKILEDRAYRNATRSGDRKNARLEMDRALGETVAAWFADAFKLAEASGGDPDFKRRLAEACFERTYPGGGADGGPNLAAPDVGWRAD